MHEYPASLNEHQFEQPSFEIGELAEADYEEAADLIKKTLRASFGTIYPEQLVEQFCQKYTGESMAERAASTLHFVAQDPGSGQLLGIIGLKDNHLRTFFVDPDCQGQGIGRALYERLEAAAREAGVSELHLEGSPLGEPAYRAFGFERVGTLEKERDGMAYSDAIMTKRLDQDQKE